MHADSGEVTRLALDGDGTRVAAGYSDGAVRVWQLEGGKLLHKFAGHRKAVSALAFNADGTVLASGARDTDIVLWDLVHGSGQYRCVPLATEPAIMAPFRGAGGGASDHGPVRGGGDAGCGDTRTR